MLFGRYEYVRELGSGTTGRVLLARDHAHGGAARAIKVVPEARAAWLAWEFARLRSVEHPRLARVHELLRVDSPVHGAFGLAARSVLLVEDFVPGEPFSRVLSEVLQPAQRERIAWLAAVGVAEALAAVHDAGLVHGDVKPDNVIVNLASLEATLLDFGFACAPQLGAVPRGTPRTMAPELFVGVSSFAADVYALGASLYDVLSDVRDAGASAASADVSLGAARRFEPLSGVSPALLDAVRALCAADAGQRPNDGREALSVLWVTGQRLGFAPAHEPLRYAVAAPARAPDCLAQRVRTLPWVQRPELLTALVEAIEAGGIVLVRGVRGAGRSRLVREALRRVTERRVEQGRGAPTCVPSLAALELVGNVESVVWLNEEHARDLNAIERTHRAAKLSERACTIVLEAPVGTELPGACLLDVPPLTSEDFVLLLRRALDRNFVPAEVVDAVERASGRFAGRVCSVVREALTARRDLDDPASYRALSEPSARLPQLSAQAQNFLTLSSWAPGAALTPEQVAPVLGGAAEAKAAFIELAQHDLMGATGTLDPPCSVARAIRQESRDSVRRLMAQLAHVHELPDSGFLRWAQGDEQGARDVWRRQALELCAQQQSEASRELLAEALSLVRDESLVVALAEVLRAQARYDEALSLLQDARSDDARLLRADVGRLIGNRAVAEREVLALTESARAEIRERVHALSARLAFDAGDIARCEACLVQLSEPVDVEASLRGLEVQVLLALARGERPAQLADRYVDRARAHAQPRLLARARGLRAQVLMREGLRARARADLREARTLARAGGEAHEVATFALNLGLVELESGELGRALESLDEAAYQLCVIDRPQDLARVLFNLGNAALLVGDHARAETVLREARARAFEHGDGPAQGLIAIAWSELCLLRGSVDEACSTLVAAIARLPEAQIFVRVLLLARVAQVWLAKGRIDQAWLSYRQAEVLGAQGDVSIAIELSTCHMRLLLAQGHVAEASEVARKALFALTETAAYAERVRLLLAAIDVSRASSNERELSDRTAECRAALERALSGLSPRLRSSMRSVPAHARVLESSARELVSREDPRSNERWRALVREARRLFAEPTRARIAQNAAKLLLELVHAERALVIVAREGHDALHVLGRAELSSDSARPAAFSRSVVERVWLDQKPVVTVEAATDARFEAVQSVHALSVRSVLAIPLSGMGERAALYLDDRVRRFAFSEDDVALVEDLAALVGQAARALAEKRAEARRARKAESEQEALSEALLRLGRDAEGSTSSAALVCASPGMARMLDLARRVAQADVPVLITGESGTGKELLARFVHDAGPRRAFPFVAESCAALPETLLESTLFGHVRGAFTGAERARRGLFEVATPGTLFLDEVGEMTPALQAKLLRVLQEGEVRPLGSERTRRVNVRVIAATHRDLAELVRRGSFREDLFYRMAVVTLELSPLRERRADIAPLVAHFVDKYRGERRVRVRPEVMRLFEASPWPGNVRELENKVRRALALCTDEIALEHVSAGAQPKSSPLELDLHAHTDLLTRKLVEEALSRAHGNLTHAAELLGVSRFGLQKMVKRYGVGPYHRQRK